MIDKNSEHHLRSDREEVRPAFPLDIFPIDDCGRKLMSFKSLFMSCGPGDPELRQLGACGLRRHDRVVV